VTHLRKMMFEELEHSSVVTSSDYHRLLPACSCRVFPSLSPPSQPETAHGEHEKRTGQRDVNWADWYAAYMVAEQSGKELPQ
jgi:hypothetical protein